MAVYSMDNTRWRQSVVRRNGRFNEIVNNLPLCYLYSNKAMYIYIYIYIYIIHRYILKTSLHLLVGDITMYVT